MPDNKPLTGYPSIDKPWLKYYSEEEINEPLPDETVYNYIKDCNKDILQSKAINYYGRNIRYRELFAKTDAVASALENMGVKSGQYVSVCMINSPETIFLIFALNKIGAVANMICGADTPSEIRQHIIDADSQFVFTLDIFQEKILEAIKGTKVVKVVVSSLMQEMSLFSRLGARILKKSKAVPLMKDGRFIAWKAFIRLNNGESSLAHDGNAPAFVTYTGGTTGGSKGVIISSNAALAVAKQYMAGEGNTKRGSKWVLILPLFIAFGVVCSLAIPFMAGMTIIIRLPFGEKMGDVCKKFKPEYFVFSPAFWEDFADKNEPLDLSYMIAPMSGGDMLTEKAEKKVNDYLQRCGCKAKLISGYGMSESSGAVSVNFMRVYEFGSVGAPFVKDIVSAFDIDTGAELRYGEEGELCFNTHSMMLGYLNNPEETKNIIREHDDGLLWIHSGDLGYITENGFIHICGRLKRYILTFYNGVAKKVFCLDIEKKLIQNPLVEKCVAIPMDSEEFNQVPAAYVILPKGVQADQETEEALKKYAEDNMEFVYRPVRYFFVDSFPQTKVGKVDYRKLEEMAKEKSI